MSDLLASSWGDETDQHKPSGATLRASKEDEVHLVGMQLMESHWGPWGGPKAFVEVVGVELVGGRGGGCELAQTGQDS